MTSENARRNAMDESRRGDQSLAAAEVLQSSGFYNDAVSRAYYAAFHWAQALLLSRGIEARTHRGVVQLFHLHFVKDGPVGAETGNLLGRLETYRELSDYTASSDFSAEQSAEEIGNATRFTGVCRSLMEQRNKGSGT